MTVAIDRAGRIVVPKPLREALNLKAGARLEVSQEDGRLVLEPRQPRMRLERRGKGRVVVSAEALPRLRASQVRAVLEAGRR